MYRGKAGKKNIRAWLESVASAEMGIIASRFYASSRTTEERSQNDKSTPPGEERKDSIRPTKNVSTIRESQQTSTPPRVTKKRKKGSSKRAAKAKMKQVDVYSSHIIDDLPKPWLGWQDPGRNDDALGWMPERARKTFDGFQDASPMFIYQVLTSEWYAHLRREREEIASKQSEVPVEPELRSAPSSRFASPPTLDDELLQMMVSQAPKKHPDSHEHEMWSEYRSDIRHSQQLDQEMGQERPASHDHEMDSGYMSDPLQSQQLVEEQGQEETKIQLEGSMPLMSSQEQDQPMAESQEDDIPTMNSQEPIHRVPSSAPSSAGYVYLITLMRPGSREVQIVRSFSQGTKLSVANKTAMSVFRQHCDLKVGQPSMILTKNYMPKCQRRAAVRWFSGLGTLHIVWKDGEGLQGKVAVERRYTDENPVREA